MPWWETACFRSRRSGSCAVSLGQHADALDRCHGRPVVLREVEPDAVTRVWSEFGSGCHYGASLQTQDLDEGLMRDDQCRKAGEEIAAGLWCAGKDACHGAQD